MEVHLVDGTYELFRQFYGAPSHRTAAGHEVGAVRGVLSSLLAMLADGATHVGVATDRVIESFRNDLWPGYKTGAGVDPVLWSQSAPLERAMVAMGLVVWPMVELEADDALASAAKGAAADPAVERVVICTPDKDLGQCVVDGRVVQLDRRKRVILDEAGVRAKFGVGPGSIPDYLALVGDSADGFPGLPGFGAKTASLILARYEHLEGIPTAAGQWEVPVRGTRTLAATLVAEWDRAILFRDLATLRTQPPLITAADDLRWRGPTEDFAAVAEFIEQPALAKRAAHLAGAR